MPLTLLRTGQSSIITRSGGNPQTRQFLEGLGFVVGTPVTVISSQGGNVIVSVKDARVAVSSQMANKIFV